MRGERGELESLDYGVGALVVSGEQETVRLFVYVLLVAGIVNNNRVVLNSIGIIP